jgi:putative thioredoxin
VRGIPAVKLFVEGDIADEFVGARPASFVQEWIEPHLPASS